MQTKSGNGHNIKLERLVEDIKVVVHDGEELLKAGMGTVRERATAGAQATDRAVREHPYQTLGMAFGIGLLAGVLTASLLSGSREEE